MSLTCAEAAAFLHAYVDGELTGADREAYEAHLRTCQACTEQSRFHARFKAAVRGHLPRPALPLGLRSRIEAALAGAPSPRYRWPWQAHPRAFTVGMAAAAALVLLVTNTHRTVKSPILEQAISTFHHDLPLDVSSESCAAVSDWFRGKVAFALQPAADPAGARCRGGRLVSLRDRLGAYVAYQVPSGHRLGVMVFPSDDEPLAGARQRVLRGQRVFIGTQRGVATVTFREPDGLDYVFAADLDEDALTNWVEKAYLTRR